MAKVFGNIETVMIPTIQLQLICLFWRMWLHHSSVFIGPAMLTE